MTRLPAPARTSFLWVWMRLDAAARRCAKRGDAARADRLFLAADRFEDARERARFE